MRGERIALSVRSLIRWPPLSEATVVAGHRALDHEVSWPATVRVRAPALDPLNGNELILVSPDVLRALDPPLRLAELIRRLIDRNVAGVVVAGDVDPAAIPIAEERGIVLMRLPASYHLHEVSQTISQVIAEQRTYLYQRGLDLHHDLVELSIAGRGLPAIVDRVGEASGRGVVLLRDDGAVVAASERGTRNEALDVSNVSAAFAGHPIGGTTPPTARVMLGDRPALAAPVVVRDAIVGYLLLRRGKSAADAEVESGAEAWTDDDLLALTRGSVVCALELAKQEAVIEAERRLRGDFFDDLLSERGESDESLIDRARHLGYDLRQPHAVLVTSGSESGESALLRGVQLFFSTRQLAVPVGRRRRDVVALLPLENESDLGPARRSGVDLQAYLRQLDSGNGVASVGIGRYHPGIPGLRTAFHEAEQALDIGQQLFGPGQVTFFGDLGVYRLLFALRDSPELGAFHDETLKTLIDYDKKNGTALVETLEVYFSCDASVQAAAEALYLHRNSLAYRLRRIGELTGLNLNSFEDCFRLQLALKARHVLR